MAKSSSESYVRSCASEKSQDEKIYGFAVFKLPKCSSWTFMSSGGEAAREVDLRHLGNCFQRLSSYFSGCSAEEGQAVSVDSVCVFPDGSEDSLRLGHPCRGFCLSRSIFPQCVVSNWEERFPTERLQDMEAFRDELAVEEVEISFCRQSVQALSIPEPVCEAAHWSRKLLC